MNYTIASLEDIQNDLTLDMVKNGNKIQVQLHHIGIREMTYKEFNTMQEAYSVFEKISKCICFGEYSYKDKKNMLK